MARARPREPLPAIRARLARKIQAALGNDMFAARIDGLTDIDEAERILRDAVAPILEEIELPDGSS